MAGNHKLVTSLWTAAAAETTAARRAAAEPAAAWAWIIRWGKRWSVRRFLRASNCLLDLALRVAQQSIDNQPGGLAHNPVGSLTLRRTIPHTSSDKSDKGVSPCGTIMELPQEERMRYGCWSLSLSLESLDFRQSQRPSRHNNAISIPVQNPFRIRSHDPSEHGKR